MHVLVRLVLFTIVSKWQVWSWSISPTSAFVPSWTSSHGRSQLYSATTGASVVHGENACFLPLKQNNQDDYAPRMVRIAGVYPGLTKEEFLSVSSEPAPDPGQWSYDFSDPSGPPVGTVALPGSELVQFIQDPVVIIADHQTLGIQLPPAIRDPVDLLVLVDRAETGFAERKFVVVHTPSDGLIIAAYSFKKDIPPGAEILGRVFMVQIPWLPGMAPTKTGFAEADEYFTS